MIKICSVVIGNTLDEFLINLKKVQEVSNFIELRVDYIKDLSASDIKIIKENVVVENIFTCRSINEGGNFSGSKEELSNIINIANNLEFNHIDIERSLLKDIKFNKKCKIIGSYHNFKKTPNYEELTNIYNYIKDFEIVDILKIATMVVNDNDNIELTKLLINKNNVIVLGMGEKGKITRIISPLLGGYLTFASVDDNISASGQFSLKELKNIYGDKYDR